ncbi:MAG: hypothetical protein ACK4RT_09730 [Erythrobacter sp.]
MASTCNVTGSLATLPGMDAAAICDRFARSLAAGLGESALPPDLAITLTLHPRGAIEARLALGGDAYPVVSVDALDRGLQPDDLDQLARVAVQMLADPAVQPAAHSKRK